MDISKSDGKDLFRQAKIYFASGQLEKSIEYFTLAENEGRDLPAVWLSRGAANIALGNFKAAREDLTRVLEVYPRDERASYYRGVAMVALGEYEKGIDDLTLSLIQNNDRGIAHLLRGLAYGELGQKADAQLDINSASAFSSAEFASFNKVFGKLSNVFENSNLLMSRKNAPWNNLLTRESGARLLGEENTG